MMHSMTRLFPIVILLSGTACLAASPRAAVPLNGTVIFGADYTWFNISKVTSTAACARRCIADVGCIAWNFRPTPSDSHVAGCWLQSDISAGSYASSSTSSAGLIVSQGVCTDIPGGDFFGGDFPPIQMKSEEPAECCAECEKNPKCWGYSSCGPVCFLKAEFAILYNRGGNFDAGVVYNPKASQLFLDAAEGELAN
eukprot:TRINITY_DN11181_c0_g1_i1.p1 TRINITY_DN11181_c0_g1~~TRINITY_DN11181_c0_g1_i1.p1  ORF type:complete len:197 (-),score=19.91 TRINITY_DN11181_c0_g1_i1:83-673(-)